MGPFMSEAKFSEPAEFMSSPIQTGMEGHDENLSDEERALDHMEIFPSAKQEKYAKEVCGAEVEGSEASLLMGEFDIKSVTESSKDGQPIIKQEELTEEPETVDEQLPTGTEPTVVTKFSKNDVEIPSEAGAEPAEEQETEAD